MATKELGSTGLTVTADKGDSSFNPLVVDQATSWSKLSLELPNFDWADKFVEFIEKVQEILNVFVTMLETLIDFLAALIEDAFIQLIKKLIDELKKLIEGFLDDLGLYMLYVPIRKRIMTNFMGLGDITPSNKALSALFQNNQQAMQGQAGDPIKKEFLTDLNRYMGGNYGFYMTVLESLYDKGDVHRPQFDNSDDYVGGMVWVMGTALDPFGLLDDIWRLIGLFGDLLKTTTTPTVPVPTGLVARAIAYPTDTTEKASFLLEWDTMPFPIVTLPDLGGIRYTPKRYAVIMAKNNPKAMGAQNVVQLLGTRQLSKGMTADNGTITVVEEADYDFTKVAYVIKDVAAKKNDSFYFYIAWKSEVYGDVNDDWGDKVTELDYWDLSNCAYVTPYPTLPRSTPPDWIRTPSIAELFPEFGYLLRLMLAEIEKLLDKLMSPAELLKQYLAFLKREVERYAALVNSILEQLKKIAELLNLPKNVGGIYARKFFGKGGNQFFLSDLANSLAPGYPNAPPYTRGDEYVLGMVWLAGGPRALVEAAMGMLDIFFPIQEEREDMISSLGDEIETMEQQFFGEDMQPEPEPAAFDESLCAITRGSKLDPAAKVPTVTFGDDFQPVSAR